MHTDLVVFCRVMAYACLRNVFPKLRVLRLRLPKKGEKRWLTSQACNESVFPVCDGIDALVSLLHVISTLLVRSNWLPEYAIQSVQNADCRLQTGYKMQTRYNCRPGTKCRLSLKCRLTRKTAFLRQKRDNIR